MATARADMKGFFKQKKKGNTGISKPSPKGGVKKKTPSPSSIGSDVVSSPASPRLQDDFDQNEEVLRQFDMNMTYGPCIGMNRLDRWSRARKLGLNPPEEIGDLLTSDKVRSESLWDGIV